jgi:hypothetical protein
MVRLRQTIAIAALLTLGGLIVTSSRPGSIGVYQREALAFWLLLLPLAVTVVGLILGRYWSRWLALAGGIAVLPWAVAITFGPRYGIPLTRPAVALAASALLLWAMLGRGMFERYEGRVGDVNWRGPRMSLVRWTIICNIASILALYVFVAAYQYRIGWHLGLMAAPLFVLIVGVWLLAHQKTIGLLLVAAACILFVPAGAYFVWTEASYTGEAILFGAIFAPGVLTGWASLLAFSRPLLAALRGHGTLD